MASINFDYLDGDFEHLRNLQCSHGLREIKSVEVFLKLRQVRVHITDGSFFTMSLDQANKSLKVNGVPLIDYYARLN